MEILIFFAMFKRLPRRIKASAGQSGISYKEIYHIIGEWELVEDRDDVIGYECDRCHKQEGVDTVEESAMARNDVSWVFDFNGTFDKWFKEVAPGSEHAYQSAEENPVECIEWRYVRGKADDDST